MGNRIPIDVLIGILNRNSSTLSMWDFKGTNAFFEFLTHSSHSHSVQVRVVCTLILSPYQLSCVLFRVLQCFLSAQNILSCLPHLLIRIPTPSDLSSKNPLPIALAMPHPMLQVLYFHIPFSLFLHLQPQFYIKSYNHFIDFHFPH